MKLNYNVYLNTSPKPIGKNDIILNGSIDSDGRLLSVSGIKVQNRDLTPSGGDSTNIPKVWGYYGHDKTAIDMQVCAEYCKYIIENVANSNHSDKAMILASNNGLSLTTSIEATGYPFDNTFGSQRLLNSSGQISLTANVINKAQQPDADCTPVLKYLDVLLSLQNELVEYLTEQTIPVVDSFNVVGDAISATESVLGIMGAKKGPYYLGSDENTVFTYTVSEVDGKKVYTIKSQPKDPKYTVMKISEDDLLFLLEYIGVTQKMTLTDLISRDLLLSGIDYEPSEDAGDSTEK